MLMCVRRTKERQNATALAMKAKNMDKEKDEEKEKKEEEEREEGNGDWKKTTCAAESDELDAESNGNTYLSPVLNPLEGIPNSLIGPTLCRHYKS
jgi:hypothetical protein